MANHAAPALVLRHGDRAELESWLRCTTVGAGQVMRARIVLAAADGLANQDIMDTVGVSRPTVTKWRGRYSEYGVDGLVDADRPGRPKTVNQSKIIAATLRKPPKRLGVTHWSSRLLAKELGLHHSIVARAWKSFGVQPWREETFKFSTDPELEAKVEDVVGLYLDPRAPRGADVSSGGERPSLPHLSQQER